MSFGSLMAHRCTIKRLNQTDVDGAPVYTWTVIKVGVKCYLDLTYLRRGKDPSWSPEAGRATDRTGVFFCGPKEPLKPGDRVEVRVRTSNEKLGTFLIEGAADLVMGNRGRPHHIEVGVTEVAAPLGRS